MVRRSVRTKKENKIKKKGNVCGEHGPSEKLAASMEHMEKMIVGKQLETDIFEK